MYESLIQDIVNEVEEDQSRKCFILHDIWNICLRDGNVKKLSENEDNGYDIEDKIGNLKFLLNKGLLIFATAYDRKNTKKQFYTKKWWCDLVNERTEELCEKGIITEKSKKLILSKVAEYEKSEITSPQGYFDGLTQNVTHLLVGNNEIFKFLRLIIKYTKVSKLNLPHILSDFSELRTWRGPHQFSQIMMLANPYIFPVVNKKTINFFENLFNRRIHTKTDYIKVIPDVFEWNKIHEISNMRILDKVISELIKKSEGMPEVVDPLIIHYGNCKKELTFPESCRQASELHTKICEWLNNNPAEIDRNAKSLKEYSLEYPLLSFHRIDLLLVDAKRTTYWVVEVKPTANEFEAGVSQVLGYAAELHFMLNPKPENESNKVDNNSEENAPSIIIKPIIAMPEYELNKVDKRLKKKAKRFKVDDYAVDINKLSEF